MKKIIILSFCYSLIGCEHLQEIRERNLALQAYYRTPEGQLARQRQQCSDLRSRIMQGSGEGIGETLFRALHGTPSSAWGTNIADQLKQQRRQRQAQRNIAYQQAVQAYNVLCR